MVNFQARLLASFTCQTSRLDSHISRTTAYPMWEVDPETRSKLLEIQKKPGNNQCCDCSAPAPQWASPKFGIFICLTCAGTHRGLGVHISFVRSISMDAFKQAEILRMQHGGNNAWKNFYENHSATKLTGVGWDDSTVAERYSGEVGEEWKERLSAKVEGKEYVPQEKSKAITSAQGSNRPSRTTSIVGSRSGTPAGVNRAKMADSVSSLRSSSPTPSLGTSSIGGSKKAQNEAYFASLGSANASRPADLPPSQGGKFTGFGSAPPGPTEQEHAEASLPGLDDLQKDPVAALTRGFGWFTTTVGKTAKTVNEDWVQPTAQKVCDTFS